MLALRANVPIVPVGIGGTERAMPTGAKLSTGPDLHGIIAPPLLPPPRTTTGRVPRNAVNETTERLRRELQDAFDQARKLSGL